MVRAAIDLFGSEILDREGKMDRDERTKRNLKNMSALNETVRGSTAGEPSGRKYVSQRVLNVSR